MNRFSSNVSNSIVLKSDDFSKHWSHFSFWQNPNLELFDLFKCRNWSHDDKTPRCVPEKFSEADKVHSRSLFKFIFRAVCRTALHFLPICVIEPFFTILNPHHATLSGRELGVTYFPGRARHRKCETNYQQFHVRRAYNVRDGTVECVRRVSKFSTV